MKIIEALKKLNYLQEKAQDLRSKVKLNCAGMSAETPVYGDEQQTVIDGWRQSHSDILKEITTIKIALQKTNLATQVTVELSGKSVTKSIAEWLIRRGPGKLANGLICHERDMLKGLTDRNMKDAPYYPDPKDKDKIEMARLIRYFSPKVRDEELAVLQEEPSLIDSALEIANATTDLLGV